MKTKDNDNMSLINPCARLPRAGAEKLAVELDRDQTGFPSALSCTAVLRIRILNGHGWTRRGVVVQAGIRFIHRE